MAIVRELVTKLGFQLDEKPLHRANEAVEKLKHAVEGLLAALAVEKVFEFFKETAENFNELQKVGERLGVSVEEVQKLKYAANQADIEFGALTKGLTILSKNLAKTDDEGSKISETLKGIGVDPTKFNNAEDALFALADKFKDMPNGIKKTTIALELFGKAGAAQISFLNKGAEGIREMMEEAEALNIVIGEEGVEAGAQFEDGLKRINSFIKGVLNQVAARLFPYLNQLIEAMVHWIKANKELIQTGIEKFAYGVAVAFRIVGIAFEMTSRWVTFLYNNLYKLIKSITGSDEATKKWIKILGVLAAALIIVTEPILLVTALIAGIALVYDDVQHYLDGKPSLFKEQYDKIVPIINKIRELWNGVVEFFINLGEVLANDYGITWERIKTAIKLAWDTSPLGIFLNHLKEIEEFLDRLEKRFSQSTIGKFIIEQNDKIGKSFLQNLNPLTAFENSISYINKRGHQIREEKGEFSIAQQEHIQDRQATSFADKFREGLEKTRNFLSNAKLPSSGAGLALATLAPGNKAISNHYALTANVNVKVDGAQDPNAVATQVGEVFQNQLDAILRSTTRATQGNTQN